MIGKHWSEHMDNQDDNDLLDAMRDEIEALKAELAALKAQPVQEPVAILHDDGYWTRIDAPAGRAFAVNRKALPVKVYAAPVQTVVPTWNLHCSIENGRCNVTSISLPLEKLQEWHDKLFSVVGYRPHHDVVIDALRYEIKALLEAAIKGGAT